MADYWWSEDFGAVSWVEITRRPYEDIGTNLWVTNPTSTPWKMIDMPMKGATVFHWDSSRGEFVGFSTLADRSATHGQFGTSNVTKRGGKTWRRELSNFTEFPAGVLTLANFRRHSSEIKKIHDSLLGDYVAPLHFPFAPYGSTGWKKLQPRQTYLAVCPSELENLIWFIYQEFFKVNKWADKPKKVSSIPRQKMKRFKVVSKRELAEIYRVANEDLVISDPSSHKLSAKALQIAAQSHAKTQNRLRLWLLKQGSKPFSPNVGHPAKFDLAWRQKRRLCVCEVKSLNRDNEEQQLRLGLGQVLRYQYLMGEHQKLKVDAVLCVERAPTEHKAWVELASRHGVKLIWPQTFNSLLD